MGDLPCSGGPSTSATEVNIAKVKEIVTKNPHSTLKVIAAELSVPHESIRTILTNNLSMKHVSARLVLKDQNFFQNSVAWQSLRTCQNESIPTQHS
jgi:hypothetical protein